MGIVVTISPSFSLYRIVVLPAASSPTKIGGNITRLIYLGQVTHQDPHLLLAEQPPEHAGQGEPHDESVQDDLKVETIVQTKFS